MPVTFIRHGQSQANIGLACPDFSLIELTPEGQAQAEALADSWVVAPDLIVQSPFLRTQQTAAPTSRRFKEVPVEVWPVQEFCNLTPSRFNGTTYAQRAPFVEEYWRRCDPSYEDGSDAESFSSLMGRSRTVLERLAALPPTSSILVFSHGFFMNAVRALIEFPGCPDLAYMQDFVADFVRRPIGNTAQYRIHLHHGQWHTLPAEASAASLGTSTASLQ